MDNIDINKFLDDSKETKEALSNLLDVLGTFGQDKETFEDDKAAILESGITFDDFVKILGDSVIEELVARDTVDIDIQLLTETAKMPTYAHDTDACADLYSDEEVVLAPGETRLISTGIAIAIPNNYVVHIYPRSSTGLKTPLRQSNSVGVIDSGYRDEIKLMFTNTSDKPYNIVKGDRLAQMCIDPSPMMNFNTVEDIKTVAGNRGGGFGSTGK